MSDQPYRVAVGTRLRCHREAAGLSQEAAAAEIGCSQAAISLYESGARNVSLDTLIALARLYGVTVEAVLSDGAS